MMARVLSVFVLFATSSIGLAGFCAAPAQVQHVARAQVVQHQVVQQQAAVQYSAPAAVATPVYAASPVVQYPIATYTAIPLFVPAYAASYSYGTPPAAATPKAQAAGVSQADLEKFKKDVRDELRADLQDGLRQIVEALRKQPSVPALEKQ